MHEEVGGEIEREGGGPHGPFPYHTPSQWTCVSLMGFLEFKSHASSRILYIVKFLEIGGDKETMPSVADSH